MTDQPIHVRVEVGAAVRTITVVANPHDALFAVSLGRAVAAAVLECAEADTDG